MASNQPLSGRLPTNNQPQSMGYSRNAPPSINIDSNALTPTSSEFTDDLSTPADLKTPSSIASSHGSSDMLAASPASERLNPFGFNTVTYNALDVPPKSVRISKFLYYMPLTNRRRWDNDAGTSINIAAYLTKYSSSRRHGHLCAYHRLYRFQHSRRDGRVCRRSKQYASRGASAISLLRPSYNGLPKGLSRSLLFRILFSTMRLERFYVLAWKS